MFPWEKPFCFMHEQLGDTQLVIAGASVISISVLPKEFSPRPTCPVNEVGLCGQGHSGPTRPTLGPVLALVLRKVIQSE